MATDTPASLCLKICRFFDKKKTSRSGAEACNGSSVSAGHQSLHLHPPKEARTGAKRFKTLRHGEAVLSAITIGELLYGAENSQHRSVALEQLRELAEILPVMPLPQSAAETYGAIREALERKGQMIGNNDLWISAHAKAAGLTLVTNNEREFLRVSGLKVQNWAW